ncbi:MAG: hypothetical protein WBH57_10130, partial [Anaerolineae bacterium]
MEIVFGEKATEDQRVRDEVQTFLREVETLEKRLGAPIVIYQDGPMGSYYIKCSIPASDVCPLLDLDARLDPASPDSYRANRELLLAHHTYKRMRQDAERGREFNDIIVEFSKEYSLDKPLKVWGGQHRVKAIQEAFQSTAISRLHGFRIYFRLSKEQRTELALISNTNIAVSNDLFDRLQEETLVGTGLRDWCCRIGLLKPEEDFPDRAAGAERITVKRARTFIVGFFEGRVKGASLAEEQLEENIYEPSLCESGPSLDPKYADLVEKYGSKIWTDEGLLQAGKAFAEPHEAQRASVKSNPAISNRKSFQNKALTESVLAGWSYVAGLLQAHPQRLANHLRIPKVTRSIPDPLNAKEMSTFQHQTDQRTYRGLATRSSLKERQRMAQVFLARSRESGLALKRELLDQGVSQVVS